MASAIAVALLVGCNQDSAEVTETEGVTEAVTEQTATEEVAETVSEAITEAANQEDEHNHEEDHDHDEEHDHDHDHAHAEDVSLADWQGSWNSMDGYYDLEENQEVIGELAEHEGVDADTYAENARAGRKTDFQSFTVDGEANTISFYSGLNEEDEIFTAEYEFVGVHEGEHHHHDHDHDHDEEHDHDHEEDHDHDHNHEEDHDHDHDHEEDHDHDHDHDHHGHDHSMWYEFRAVGESEYPTILLMDVHGEQVMAHFHMRYGDNVEELDEKEEWFPTFIDPSTPMAQVQEFL